MVILLLASILSLAFNFQIAKALGGTTYNVYIMADGSVNPSTAPIQHVGNLYGLTGNISDSTVVIMKSNIIFDGNGYTLQGKGSGYGVYWSGLDGTNNITIKNVIIKAFNLGISNSYSSNNNIIGNNITNNDEGIHFNPSSNNSISGNNIAANSQNGITLYSSSDNRIFGNSITANGYGLFVEYSSSNNRVFGNSITANGYGIEVYSSSNNNISGNEIKANSEDGIYVEYSSSNNRVFGNNITANGYGVIGRYWNRCRFLLQQHTRKQYISK